MMSYGSQAERAWHLDEAAAEPIVKAAADGGVTFFDTADTYSDGLSEEITGRLLARLFECREDYVLATKVYFPMGAGPNDRGLSRKHVLAAIDASLRRLGTDYVDLYQAITSQLTEGKRRRVPPACTRGCRALPGRAVSCLSRPAHEC